MITVRHATERGREQLGWLDSRHTFSFGSYHDPHHMGFRALRVINEDRVLPRQGFDTHPHRDMEILTYVLEGTLAHKDSTGSGSSLGPGDVQRMSAGTGVLHSEVNASGHELLHFLQIWILPERRHLTPSYAQKRFDLEATPGEIRLLGSRDGRDGSLVIHQDVSFYGVALARGQAAEQRFAPGRHVWVQVARGAVRLGEIPLVAGDGAAVTDQQRITLVAPIEPAEVLIFDLA